MAKLPLCRLSLLTVCSAAVLSAAPVPIGTLFINDVGTGYANPLEDQMEFHLANFTGGPANAILTPVMFRNVTLNVTWQSPGVSLTNPLNWYLPADEKHFNPIQPADLAPSNEAYESSFFQRGWIISEVMLRIEFDPGVWVLTNGPTVNALPFQQFVFTPVSIPLNTRANVGPPAWDLFLNLDPVTEIPEPSTYMLGGLGMAGIVAQRLRRRC
jgi:hypothetical protein